MAMLVGFKLSVTVEAICLSVIPPSFVHPLHVVRQFVALVIVAFQQAAACQGRLIAAFVCRGLGYAEWTHDSQEQNRSWERFR